MKKNILTVFYAIIFIFAPVMMYSQTNTSMNKYEKEWAEIEKLREQQLPQSLLPKVEAVYQAALQDKNYEQLIKAIIFQLNCIGILEENEEGANRIFNSLKKDAEALPQPVKSILYSMLGQMYEEFYEQNMWAINSRTTAHIEQPDVRTWDTRQLKEEALKYYKLSLQDIGALQNEPIERYGAFLLQNMDVSYQPTLFDLLANRALDFYTKRLNFVSLPQSVFTVKDPDYFADAQTFINLNIETEDTLSGAYLSLITIQELLRFHLKSDSIAALIDVDLRRMSFLRENGNFADNETMYEEALIRMSKTYQSYHQNANILLYLADFYVNQAEQWRNDKKEEYKPGYSKALALCERIEKEYPNRLVENVNTLKKRIFFKELNVVTEGVQQPGQPFLAQVKFRNLDVIYKTVYTLTEAQAVEYNANSYRYGYDQKRLADFIQSLKKEVSEERVNLPTTTDFQYYTTEIKMPPLKDGFYFIVFADTKAWQTASEACVNLFVQASPLMALERTLENEVTVIVTDRKTGEPVAGAKITTYQNETVQAAFTSDKNGIAKNKMSQRNNSHYQVTVGNKSLIVFNALHNRSIYLPDADRAVIFTDRSIYRPGQTVYFKAILYHLSADKEKELLRAKNVKVSFRDANRQLIAEQNLKTNDFGSINGSFTIPHGLLNGHMTIEFERYGNAFISVEEYKRPTFEVKFNPLVDNYSFNEQATVTAVAKAFAGYAIDHAKVQYRVVRRERYPYYFYWNPPSFNVREISSGTLQTDEKGNVTVAFTTLAEDDGNENKYYTYSVTVDVTDVNGETRSASIDVNIGSKPLLINTNLAENVLNGQKERFTVETTNLNGDFTPASVKVELVSLKSPDRVLRKRLWNKAVDLPSIREDDFRKNFPLDAYNDEMNPDKFSVLRTVAAYTIETAENKKLDLSALKNSGYYRLTLTADNKKGVVVDYVRYFYFTSDKPEAISSMEHWMTVVKDTGEPGEQAEFLIAGGENNAYVYCEVIQQSRIVEAKWIKTGKKPLKVTFPIHEAYRGGFEVQFNMVQNNRLYSKSQLVSVPYTNKMLDVTLSTFRDQLLPGERETWNMLISNKKGEKETAEIVASLYDASLDALKPHNWNHTAAIYEQTSYSNYYRWGSGAIHRFAILTNVNPSNMYYAWSSAFYVPFYANINWFDETYKMAFGNFRGPLMRVRSATVAAPSNITIRGDEIEVETMDFTAEDASFAQMESYVASRASAKGLSEISDAELSSAEPVTDLTAVATRTNFNETAFFYPALRTNENGEVLIAFTMPEALTRWKLLSFAHTKDFKTGSYVNELITQKQVAVSANAPRFFRENDVVELTAKVNNLTEADLNGQALLRLYDAMTMQPVDYIIQPDNARSFDADSGVNEQKGDGALSFSIHASGSTGLKWKLVIPEGVQAITYQLTAQAGTHSDGEEKTIPVLTNSMLVTETLPFSVRAGREKTFTFNRLLNNKSKTLRHHSLTLEYTSAPAWYAVQALPYIMEYPYECAEQTFSRYYANTLATTVANSTPRIKQIFEQWNTTDSKALWSNLEKNQELKQVILEETPWVMQAQNESERKKRIGLLFDLNRMSNEMSRAFNKLKQVQNSDGGFPWFTGNPSNRYITQHIVVGMAHLKKLDAMQTNHADEADMIVQKGLAYLDQCIEKDYNELIRLKANLTKQHIGSLQLHYLYACSFNGHKPEGVQKVAYDYYLQQTVQFWSNFTVYEKALAALVLHRNNQTEKAMPIIRSLKEYAQQSEEMGMYWKENVAGYFWYQAPIETQALLMEAFNEVANDIKAVDEMKIWLLRNKQTNDWKTTKATSEAIYALLMTGGNLLDESKLLEIEIAGKPLADVVKEDIKPEPGTGYVKTSWIGSDITSQMGRVKVKNPNTKGIAWGGLYWQYFEQLDKITSAETNLRMNKQLFLRTLTPKGEELQPLNGEWRMENGESSLTPEGEETRNGREKFKLHVGDIVRVRMELRADRDYEYVHLKDMRASGFEPVNTISGHRYQDGLWYYESIKDASTNFFITYLPKGTYVFEYSLRVTHAGDFSNGITTFQCMYAPEFSAHSEGIRVTIVE